MGIDDKLLIGIKKIYESTDSLRETAAQTGMSEQRARRLLITAGAKINNETTQRILSLYQEGKTVDEIAALEHKTTKAVLAHLPYTRGPLNRWTDAERKAVADGKDVSGRSTAAQRTVRSRSKKTGPITALAIQRKRQNINQQQLADKSGVSVVTIRAYEQEQRDIKKAAADTLLKLADALHCTIKDLI
ncbi:MAG: helix-turn-helix transcriptional regulator [Sporolactobacillus sp.]